MSIRETREAMNARYAEAFNRGDAAACADLYAEDAAFLLSDFGTAIRESLEGSGRIRESIEGVQEVAEQINTALQEQSAECRSAVSPFTLDLDGLMSADADGVETLRSLAAEGAELHGASPYIRQLLHRDLS